MSANCDHNYCVIGTVFFCSKCKDFEAMPTEMQAMLNPNPARFSASSLVVPSPEQVSSVQRDVAMRRSLDTRTSVNTSPLSVGGVMTSLFAATKHQLRRYKVFLYLNH